MSGKWYGYNTTTIQQGNQMLPLKLLSYDAKHAVSHHKNDAITFSVLELINFQKRGIGYHTVWQL